MTPSRVVFDKVTVRYPDARTEKPVEAVREMSFTIEDKPGVGEMVVFLGPSGCGKSTILKAIAGLLPVDEGRIEVTGNPVGPPGRGRPRCGSSWTTSPIRTGTPASMSIRVRNSTGRWRRCTTRPAKIQPTTKVRW